MRKNSSCLIILAFIFVLTSCVSSKENTEKQYGISKDDWAYYNYGQKIEDQEGTAHIDINIIQAWDISRGIDSIIVGLVDTGVDTNGNRIKNNFVKSSEIIDGMDNNKNGFIDDVYGWNFYDNSNQIYKSKRYDYHGTYLANNIIRIAPNVRLLPVKFLESTTGKIDDCISAIEYAVKNGARVINCSWNFENYNDKLYNIIKNNPNVLFVCSAGNSNIDIDKTEIFPCSYKLDNLISVMAIDNQGQVYEASGYGEDVDIAAPGKEILVEFPEDKKCTVNGTSISGSFVTGAAALMLSVNNCLSPNDIKNIILESATHLDSLNSKCKSAGYINIYECIKRCQQLKE